MYMYHNKVIDLYQFYNTYISSFDLYSVFAIIWYITLVALKIKWTKIVIIMYYESYNMYLFEVEI